MHVKPKKETIIEDGWYPAKIAEVQERETKFGEKLLVPFDVDASGDTIAIDARLSLSDHPKSNLVKWAKQLFGDREFDTDEFCGPPLRGVRRGGRGLGRLPQELHPQAPACEGGQG